MSKLPNLHDNVNENDKLNFHKLTDKYRTLLYAGAISLSVANAIVDISNHESGGSIIFDGAAAICFIGAAVLTPRHENPTTNPEN